MTAIAYDIHKEPWIRVPPPQVLSLLVVVLAHVGLLALVWQQKMASPELTPPSVLMATLSSPLMATESPRPTPKHARPSDAHTPARPHTQPGMPAPTLPMDSAPLQSQQNAPAAVLPMSSPLSAPLRQPETESVPVDTPALATPPAVTPPRSDAAQLNNPRPAYPPLSRRLAESGRVLMDVYILADGTVGEIKLRQSSGYTRLDAAALQAVRKWRYVPARRGSEPIAYWYVQPLAFFLN